jgi:hypothetical protein
MPAAAAVTTGAVSAGWAAARAGTGGGAVPVDGFAAPHQAAIRAYFARIEEER